MLSTLTSQSITGRWMRMKRWWNGTDSGNRSTRWKTCLSAILFNTNPHGLTWDWTFSPLSQNWQLTTWVIAWGWTCLHSDRLVSNCLGLNLCLHSEGRPLTAYTKVWYLITATHQNYHVNIIIEFISTDFTVQFCYVRFRHDVCDGTPTLPH